MDGITPLKPGLCSYLAQDCLLCATASSSDLLCPACAADLPRWEQACCPCCARPTVHGEICGSCLSKPPSLDATHAVYRYEFPLDKLIQAFKYGHRLALGAYFGRQLSAQVAQFTAPTTKPDRLIPLPLHGERLRTRGFNQALELARPISAQWQIAIDTTSCQRIHNTPAQADLSWRQRLRNIRGAFHCTADLHGQHILLIDDVMTTGASLNECARTLKRHGAATVTALVVARAVPKT
jgi:ComF family protein